MVISNVRESWASIQTFRDMKVVAVDPQEGVYPELAGVWARELHDYIRARRGEQPARARASSK